MRIFPEMWASTLCPFSSSTRNMAFGSGSTTVPSTRIVSSLGLAREHHLRGWSAPEARKTGGERTGTDRREYLIRLQVPSRHSGERQHLGTTVGDRDGVLEVRGAGAVDGHDRPAVVEYPRRGPSRRHHRLDGEDHAGPQAQSATGRAVGRDVRLFVHGGARAGAPVLAPQGPARAPCRRPPPRRPGPP